MSISTSADVFQFHFGHFDDLWNQSHFFDKTQSFESDSPLKFHRHVFHLAYQTQPRETIHHQINYIEFEASSK